MNMESNTMKCPRKKGAEGAEKSSQVLKRTTSVSSAPLRNIAVSTEMYSASGVDIITSQIRDCIAPEFSSESSYSVGDLCIKDGILYCCSVNHLGEWNASHFTQTSVSSKLTENSVLSPIYSDTPTFNEWTYAGIPDGWHMTVFEYQNGNLWYIELENDETQQSNYCYKDGSENDTRIEFLDFDNPISDPVIATRTRTDIVGYTLGSQSDKPLQPKGDYLPIDANTRAAINDLANLTETDNLATVKSRINSLMDILKGAITTASFFILSAILNSPLFGATQLNAFNPTNEIYSAQEVNEYVKTQALSRAEAEIGYTDWKVTSTNAEVISSSVNWQQESSSWVIDVTTLEDGVENQYSYTNSPSTGLETEITFIVGSSEPTPVVITNPKTVITFEDGISQEYDWSGEINRQTMVNEGLFDEDEVAWTTNITGIVIGTNVTSIGDQAFLFCGVRTSVTIPNSVTNIGKKAFYGCFSLKSITIGNSVTSIGEYAFYKCSGLTTITCNALTAPTVQNSTFGNGSADYIGRNTYNTGNNKLIVPAGATGYDSSYWANPLQDSTKCGFTLEYSSNIREPLTARTSGVYIFTATRIRLRPTLEMEESWNTNIEALQFKEWYPDGSVTNKNQWTMNLNYALDSTSKTAEITQDLNITGSVVIPPYVDYDNERYTVTSIGDEAFRDCSSLTSVVIPNSVTNIGVMAFYHCTNLTSVVIPNSVTSIGRTAFENCDGLTSVTIPDSVTSIGGRAFYGCRGLTSVTIGNGVTSIAGFAFSYCRGLTSVIIPNSVTNIGDYAFSQCTGLTSVLIPDTVMSIGGFAFSYCTKLSEVNFGSKEFQSIPTLDYPAYVFQDVPTTCKFIIPDDNYSAWVADSNWVALKSMGYQFTKYSDWEAPHRYELSSLASTNYVNEAIGNLVIPTVGTLDTTATNSQSTTSSESLSNNITLHKISKTGSYNDLLDKPELPTLSGKIYDMSTNEGYFRAIEDLIRVLGGTFTNGLPPPNPKTVITFEDGTSQEYDWSGEINRSTMTNEGLFDEDEATWILNITGIVIGTNVTSIGSSAFYGCSDLTSVAIPDSVTSIGDYAFYNCYALTSVAIPNSVTSIGDSAFSECSSLTSITILSSVTSIGNEAFYNCSGLTSVTIPDSVVSIGDSAFYNCSSLTSVTIGNGVTGIGNWAFYQCINLTTITCNALTAPTVQSDTFGGDGGSWTGRNTYDTGNNKLIVPQGATGYTTGAWADPLCSNTKCGFTLEYAAQ